MRNLIVIVLVFLISSCANKSADDYITVNVKQVEQVGSYTYMLVKAKGPEYWIAVSTMNAKPGDTYRYKGGLIMENFYSAQLDRTFKEVIFLDEILSDSPSLDNIMKDITPGSSVKSEKASVNIESAEGITSIAELYANSGSYNGKVVRVKGEVTKYNGAIMDRNWIHIQDGSEHDGKFDLTVTSIEEFEVGSVVVIEGTLSINQDFGYGYSYEILLEEAAAVR